MSWSRRRLLATAGLLLGGILLVETAAAQDVVVAVTAIVEHPALDACRDGIEDELKAGGYEDGKNLKFVYESAQGNPGTAVQIAQKFVGENPTVIVPISTPSAQAVVAATSDIPVVFTAVTDPLGAKLVTNLEKPGGNVTGMSDLSPIAKHLELIKEMTPNAKKIGVPYNPGEANAVTLVELLKEKGAADGLRDRRGAGAEIVRRAGGGAEPGRQGRRDLRADRQHHRLGARGGDQGRHRQQAAGLRRRHRLGEARRHRGGRLQLLRRRPADRQDRRCAC